MHTWVHLGECSMVTQLQYVFFPNVTDFLRFCTSTSDVVFADLRWRLGWYQLSKSHKYKGSSEWRTLETNSKILNCMRFFTGSQCKSRRTGVICWRLGVFLQHELLPSVQAAVDVRTSLVVLYIQCYNNLILKWRLTVLMFTQHLWDTNSPLRFISIVFEVIHILLLGIQWASLRLLWKTDTYYIIINFDKTKKKRTKIYKKVCLNFFFFLTNNKPFIFVSTCVQ